MAEVAALVAFAAGANGELGEAPAGRVWIMLELPTSNRPQHDFEPLLFAERRAVYPPCRPVKTVAAPITGTADRPQLD